MKNIVLGTECSYQDQRVTIQKFVDFKKVIIKDESTGELFIEEIRNLDFSEKLTVNQKYIDSISDEDWVEANRKYSIILPLITAEKEMNLEVNKSVLVRELSEKHNVGYVTIYRWLKNYQATGLISSLIPIKRDGGKGKSRLNEEVEKITVDAIEEVYLNKQRLTKKETAIEIIRRCKNAGVTPPHRNTIYNRLQNLDKEKTLVKRLGYIDVDQKISPVPGTYTEAKNPLDIIQIDHTVLDIIVVSEDEREPIGRPLITLAIDVYSRMVAGLYISLDPPGALGTGICLSNVMLPKEDICAKYELKSEWPFWGVMKNVHMDNAKEFKGKMILRAAQEYGFNINWRPRGKARYGAHIERLLGTFSRKIHTLPGTTFESIKYRGNYNSEAQAVMTLSELEKWLHIQIVDVYHNTVHSTINMTPLQCYKEGVFGSKRKDGIGLSLMKFHPDKVRLDFLPIIERTIQRTGVVIDHIRYYSDIFRNYLYEKAWSANDRFYKNKRSKSHIFKRDPRDISKIYFYYEQEARYVEITYADMRRPPISIWEYRKALKKAAELNPSSQMTEDLIFDAYNRMKKIEEEATLTKKKVKNEAKRKERKRKVEEFGHSLKSIKNSDIRKESNFSTSEIDISTLEPFDFENEI